MKLELRNQSITLEKMRPQFLLSHQFKEGNPQIAQITPIREKRLVHDFDQHLRSPGVIQREATVRHGPSSM
jgi:hypothetical protein